MLRGGFDGLDPSCTVQCRCSGERYGDVGVLLMTAVVRSRDCVEVHPPPSTSPQLFAVSSALSLVRLTDIESQNRCQQAEISPEREEDC